MFLNDRVVLTFICKIINGNFSKERNENFEGWEVLYLIVFTTQDLGYRPTLELQMAPFTYSYFISNVNITSHYKS